MLLFSVVLIYFFDDLFSKISFVLIRYEVHLILRFAREIRLFVSFFYTCSSNDQFQFHLHILSFALVNRGTHWQIILYIIKFKATDLFFVILLHCVGDMQFLFFNGKLIKIGDLLRNLKIFIQFLIECIRCQSVMHQKWNDAWPEKKITLTPRLN